MVALVARPGQGHTPHPFTGQAGGTKQNLSFVSRCLTTPEQLGQSWQTHCNHLIKHCMQANTQTQHAGGEHWWQAKRVSFQVARATRGPPSDLSHLFRTFCARRVSTEHQWCWLFAYAARCQFGWDGNKMPWNWQIVHELKFKIDQGFVVPLTCASQTFSVTQIANATNATEKHCPAWRYIDQMSRWGCGSVDGVDKMLHLGIKAQDVLLEI